MLPLEALSACDDSLPVTPGAVAEGGVGGEDQYRLLLPCADIRHSTDDNGSVCSTSILREHREFCQIFVPTTICLCFKISIDVANPSSIS